MEIINIHFFKVIVYNFKKLSLHKILVSFDFLKITL